MLQVAKLPPQLGHYPTASVLGFVEKSTLKWTAADCDSIATCADGAGFCAKIYRLKYSGGRSVIAKIFSHPHIRDEPNELERARGNMLHESILRELAVYQKFSSEFLAAKIPVAAYYESEVTDHGALIIMSDVANAQNPSLAEGLDEKQIRQVVESVARMQLVQISQTQGDELPPLPSVAKFMSRYAVDCVHILSARNFDWLPREKVEILTRVASQEGREEALDVHKRHGLSPVLVHGDLWPNNILIDSESRELRAILDWQGFHFGSPTTDLADIIGSSLEPSLRQKITESLLDQYQTIVGDRVHVNSEAFKLCWRESFGQAVMRIAMTLVFNEAKDQPKAENGEGPLTRRFHAMVDDYFELLQ